jgi:FtsH-binding integral membrane protein
MGRWRKEEDKMTLKAFMIFTAILGIAYAVGFLLVPGLITDVYGDSGGAPVDLAYRFFGVALLGIGLIFWFARDCNDAAAIRAVLIGGAVSNAVGVVVSIWGSITHIMNALGWTVVLIYVVLLAGCLYFLRSPDTVGRSARV